MFFHRYQPLFEEAPGSEAGGGGGGGGAAPAWHEAIITKGADNSESLTDPAKWLGTAPAPLREFITANMTAARQKTEGMVRVPGADARPEDWAAFHKAIGVPDNPEGYGLKAPEKLPEGITHDAEMEKAFLGRARELGLTAKQVAGLRDFQIDYTGGMVAKNREATAAAIAAEKQDLQKRFGDKIDSAVATAQKLTTAKWLPEGMKKYLSDGGIDPASGNFGGADFLEFMVAAAKATGEDSGAGGLRTTHAGSNTRDYWKSVMADKDHPDNIALRKQDKDAVRRYNEAYRNGV